MEVRREDQEKINKFSSLHQKETTLEEELRAKIVSTYRLILSLSSSYKLACLIVVLHLSASLQRHEKRETKHRFDQGQC
jgi:hypothetical protein